MQLGRRAARLELKSLDAPADLQAVGEETPGGAGQRHRGVANHEVEGVIDAVAPARIHVELEVRDRKEGFAGAVRDYELQGGSPSSR